MSFLENLKEFFSIAQQTNYNFAEIFAQTPNGVYSVAAVLAVILLIVIFLIRRSVKISSTVKLVSQIQNASTYDDYNSKLTKLATELPKRGKKVAESMNLQKNDILQKELELLKDFNIKDKIDRYKQISSQYALISQNSKKYHIDEFTAYYDDNSKKLLDENLFAEIEEYSLNSLYTLDDVENVNSIVAYSQTRDNTAEILRPMIDTVNKFSFGFNLELFKFTMALTKEKSGLVYENCNEKLKTALTSENEKVSDVILTYMLENDLKEDVYSYITNLKSKVYLQDAYYNFFGKTEDIDLDLAFVANETQIENDYANYTDSKITNNWRDLGLIKHIIESPRVLETIGHISYRSVLERIENLEKDEETNKAISEALDTARRAESIALEAKEIARQK